MAKNTTKRKGSKPKPSDLGTGQAARAGKALKGRRSRLDAIEAAAVGKKKKPAKKNGRKK